jgi:predicted amidohydrolase YtcJ
VKVDETVSLNVLKWRLEHAETISPENIERVQKLGGGIALDAKWRSTAMVSSTPMVARRLWKPRLCASSWIVAYRLP